MDIEGTQNGEGEGGVGERRVVGGGSQTRGTDVFFVFGSTSTEHALIVGKSHGATWEHRRTREIVAEPNGTQVCTLQDTQHHTSSLHVFDTT